MYKVGLDLMGGDNAPSAPLNAAIKFAMENKNLKVFVFGEETLKEKVHNIDNIEFIVTSQIITNEDDPVKSIRSKSDSSIVVGSKYVKEGKIDCLISAGSTGALVACGVFITKRLTDIERPSLPGLFPSKIKNTPTLVLDIGANVETKPTHMHQNATLASVYMNAVYKLDNPTVALLNIGTEEKKGSILTKEVFDLLSKDDNLNFVGNIEARDILTTKYDIVVTDGFTGNILLKSMEGSITFMSCQLKEVFMSNTLTKLAALIIKKKYKNLKSSLDYKEIGAVPIFGIQELLLKAHGSSNDKAFYSALVKSKEIIDSNYISLIKGEK